MSAAIRKKMVELEEEVEHLTRNEDRYLKQIDKLKAVVNACEADYGPGTGHPDALREEAVARTREELRAATTTKDRHDARLALQKALRAAQVEQE